LSHIKYVLNALNFNNYICFSSCFVWDWTQ